MANRFNCTPCVFVKQIQIQTEFKQRSASTKNNKISLLSGTIYYRTQRMYSRIKEYKKRNKRKECNPESHSSIHRGHIEAICIVCNMVSLFESSARPGRRHSLLLLLIQVSNITTQNIKDTIHCNRDKEGIENGGIKSVGAQSKLRQLVFAKQMKTISRA